MHINKPEKKALKTFNKLKVEVTQNEQSNSDFSETSFSENSDLYKAPNEDNSQSNIVIGISVGIAVISLVAMFLLIINIVNKKKKMFNNNYKNEIRTPQFKIVPINRSNLKSSRFQPASNFNDLTGCFQTDAKDTSIQSSEFTNCTEFDYYDYPNNQINGSYSSGGRMVHV